MNFMTTKAKPVAGSKEKLPAHLKRLEAESIEIIREVVAEFRNPVMLYSIGKDSSVMLHLAIKAFLSVAAAVPAHARRYDVEVPRDDRLSRRDRQAARSQPDRLYQPGAASSAASVPFASGSAVHTHVMKTEATEAGARQISVRRRFRRRPPRRGKEPRQGAHLFLPLQGARLGSAQPASGTLEPVQHPHPPGRVDPRLPAVELDRTRRLAAMSSSSRFRWCRSISPRSARWWSAPAR